VICAKKFTDGRTDGRTDDGLRAIVLAHGMSFKKLVVRGQGDKVELKELANKVMKTEG